jgi:hypothetical protein
VLFLYRPRQTWMPYRPPRPVTQQDAYNRQLQGRFDATRRVGSTAAPPASDAAPVDTVASLKELAALHASGFLDDAEFGAAKARVLGETAQAT